MHHKIGVQDTIFDFTDKKHPQYNYVNEIINFNYLKIRLLYSKKDKTIAEILII